MVGMHSKFKFCFLELSGFFFPEVFSRQLVESMDVEPADTENQLYLEKWNKMIPLYLRINLVFYFIL